MSTTSDACFAAVKSASVPRMIMTLGSLLTRDKFKTHPLVEAYDEAQPKRASKFPEYDKYWDSVYASLDKEEAACVAAEPAVEFPKTTISRKRKSEGEERNGADSKRRRVELDSPESAPDPIVSSSQTPPAVAESPLFFPGPLCIQHWQTFSPLQPIAQLYEYPTPASLVHGFHANSGGSAPGLALDAGQAAYFSQDSGYPYLPSLTAHDISVIDPRLLNMENPSGSPFYHPSLSRAPPPNQNPFFYPNPSPSTPDIERPEVRKAPPALAALPRYSEQFAPVSGTTSSSRSCFKRTKPPLPQLLKTQVRETSLFSCRTPRSPEHDHYDEDEVLVSRAVLTPEEIRVRNGKAMGKSRNRKILGEYPSSRNRSLYPQLPPTPLRTSVKVISDEEKRFIAEFEPELRQELEEQDGELVENSQRQMRPKRCRDNDGNDDERPSKVIKR